MIPAFKNPRIIWIIPAITTANKKVSYVPRSVIPFKTITVNPAAGPVTLNAEPLTVATRIPPIIPAIIPEKSGAPDANAIPKHKGNATKKTTNPAGRSSFKNFNEKEPNLLRLFMY